VKTAPTSQESSSKLLSLEPKPGKRSRSTNNKQVLPTVIHNTDTTGKLPGSELLERVDVSQGKRSRSDSQESDHAKHKNVMDNIRRRQLSKVETVRVLRARSGFLAPIAIPPLFIAGIIPGSSQPPSHFQPFLLKPEERQTGDRKKKRR